MSLIYNAAEVFQIGIDIEKNGRIYYTKAAEMAANDKIRGLFTELASWEEQHIILFEELASHLTPRDNEEAVWDPQGEAGLYLKATADSHIFNAGSDPASLAAGCDTARDALKVAITFEKDSVVFYSSMRTVVPEHLGKDKVERLIQEELHHIAILTEKMRELG